MADYFFTYGSYVPVEYQWSLFGTGHIVWMLLILATGILLIKKLPGRRLEIALGIYLMGWTILRICWLSFIGSMSIYELPLHLCSLAAFFCFIYVWRKWDFLGQVLYALCLPGTMLALIFPDWTMYPIVSMGSIEGFTYHAGVLYFICLELALGNIRPQVRSTWKVCLFTAVLTLVIYCFDRAVSANYMFLLSPPAGSPLELMENLLGRSGYLIGYAAAAFAVVLIMELYGTMKSMKFH